MTFRLVTLCLVFTSSKACQTPKNLDWWQTASFYQVYPRSFKDSNNDGIGDLHGVIEKLSHFSDAGVDAVWLSPIFQSPQKDQGYDISNYTDIESDYGTVNDVIKLVKEAKARRVKIILDFVPNHTSDQHQWFIDSVNGVEEFQDYYVWANGKVDEDGNRLPPNNWISNFKNSAWTWNERRKQYYLHQFSSAQPDLNYRNPAVVKEMKDVLLFWLDRGIAGFRVDVPTHLFEDAQLRDEPLSNLPGYDENDYEYRDHIYTLHQKETYDMVYQWRRLLDTYTQEQGTDQKIMLAEVYAEIDQEIPYFGTLDGTRLGAHLPFNFFLISEDNENSTAPQIAQSVNKWLTNIPVRFTSNWVIGNHDRHRAATRYGTRNVDGFNMLKAILPGAVITYNGEEIGQENGEVSFEEGQDPSARDRDRFEETTRDFERTPFQWDDSVNAGFNQGAKPWLPVSYKYKETNLRKQRDTDDNSHFKIYQALAKLRKTSRVLQSKETVVKALDDNVIFVKRSGGGSYLVLVFNRGHRESSVDVSCDVDVRNVVEIVSDHSTRKVGSSVDPASLNMAPHEAIILQF